MIQIKREMAMTGRHINLYEANDQMDQYHRSMIFCHCKDGLLLHIFAAPGTE